ncbi:RNA-guided endonuclease InsQ/TnpB family protein [Brockia lithotrophica]|uniref:RNA-guided endonuclease InsQ/TnpB family protein n=1 Tax=Brockia lithotrophica TaxID=933949 RepID=UPI001FE8B9A1|nr:RNA-guided endonuclease TnpB family protein [Brockia lithotrophica]
MVRHDRGRKGVRKVGAPKPLGKALRRLKRLQRKLSRRGVRDKTGRLVERTKNYEKARLEVAKLHRNVRNIRLDFLLKLTAELVRVHPVIAIEGLNVAGMLKNGHLAWHIAVVGWSTSRALLKAKAKLRALRLVKANHYEPTSKTCYVCGHVLYELPLSTRKGTCPVCGTNHRRDENTAKTQVRLGRWLYDLIASSAGSDAYGGEHCGGMEIRSASTSS